MKFRKLFENWDMTSLKIKASFLEMEWAPKDADKDAAWELYVELLTRITTQALKPQDGDDATALASIHSIFGITREVLKRRGRDCLQFAKVAVVILNQVIRPFTAKWHKYQLSGRLLTKEGQEEFRTDLLALQPRLIKYAQMLADIADVEDITKLEEAME